MSKLRDNSEKSEEVRDKTKALFSQLLDFEEEYAIKLIDWYLEKTSTNKRHIRETELLKEIKSLKDKTDENSIERCRQARREKRKVLPNNYPENLQNGDIVWVNYGQGYAGELSSGHYGIVITRKGSHFLIAPLTKTVQPDKENTMKFENLGLPGKNGIPVETGYVVFNQMGFVHYRRLENIIGIRKRKNVSSNLTELLTKFNKVINK